ncbi:uncharacterized protein LOC129570695 [Sitodiplosis mosellana]|uniref:uncharacterized protein LOC129570695 n=1 Tax=Sitodiplosis mosellana TaxID=263140 RepID=UPI002443B13B|nr:uncharacterized protein LOC129570695 [Sitodiplosis mosellana]
MSLQDVVDNKQMKTVKQNQNQVAVAGAIAPNGEPQPSVFKLDADCWDEVFDCLSLEDVHSFGQTCKAFQHVTGTYFQWQYEATTFGFGLDGFGYRGNRMVGFSKFARKINLAIHSVGEWLPYVDLNCESVEHLTFALVDFSQMETNLIEHLGNILKKVRSLELLGCECDRDILGPLIESCAKLERMTCYGTPPSGWTNRDYPTLQHMDLAGNGFFGTKKFREFLAHCPNIRSLAVDARVFWKARRSILNFNVELDDLAMEMDPNVDIDIIDVGGLLKVLHQRGFYKRLHLYSPELTSPDQLTALPGLVTLYTESEEITEIPVLPNIKEFGIVDGDAPDIDTNALAIKFLNLQHLFITKPSFTEILPFIGRSKKLEDIEIAEYQGTVLDIAALNKERKKLAGARKVIIYVGEDVYLATKWATTETSLELIELKRKQSRKMIRPHSFWTDFRTFDC